MKFQNPVIYIQPDWHEVLSVNGGKAWILCKYKDEPGIHGTIEKVIDSDGSSSLQISDDFIIEKLGLCFIHIKHKNSKFSTYFLKPSKSLSNLHKKSVNSLSISPNGMAVSSSSDDSFILWNTEEEIIKQNLTGHAGEVYKCRFFPSGLVVFSAGSDMRLKIWCAKTGQCPVTLVGHTMAVTDVAIVDRGRNVLSCSKDGFLKLWNCGDSSCIYNIIKLPTSINSCKLSEASAYLDLGQPNHELSEKEVNTANKVVLLGCENGSVQCIALKSHKKIFSVDFGSAVNCVCFITCDYFVVGCQDGCIHLCNMKCPRKPDLSWKESNSAVLSLLEYNSIGYFSSRADGAVEFIFIKGYPLLKISLTGADCDPVYDIATDGDHIYTCCRDSKIRCYYVKEIISELTKLEGSIG
ncbi:proteasomal ATPase-associated factor 1-like [Rhodnius prolixus]|uniref:WD_REPEATS_REGION domain-containing protein n=2 Tax=Rhodnius TaxID=13248 RepID=T1HFQ0_RHOPR